MELSLRAKRLQDAIEEEISRDKKERVKLKAFIEKHAKALAGAREVSHLAKATHSDSNSRGFRHDKHPPPKHRHLVGSHCLQNQNNNELYDYSIDGGAAGLPLVKFFTTKFDNKTVIQLACDNDPDLAQLFEFHFPGTGPHWMRQLRQVREGSFPCKTDQFSKQVYWFKGEDAHADDSYHLLIPIFSSSLAQRCYQDVQHDLYGEEAKMARTAKSRNQPYGKPVHRYPKLLQQKIGGAQPQNISHLNSKRGGANYLFPNLPPILSKARPLYGSVSFLPVYRRRPEVGEILSNLIRILRGWQSTQQVRQRRDQAVRDLLEQLACFTLRYRTLPPGWSDNSACTLKALHKHWLDCRHQPHWPSCVDDLAAEFARFLNIELKKHSPHESPFLLGDDEYRHWRKLAQTELNSNGDLL